MIPAFLGSRVIKILAPALAVLAVVVGVWIGATWHADQSRAIRDLEDHIETKKEIEDAVEDVGRLSDDDVLERLRGRAGQ